MLRRLRKRPWWIGIVAMGLAVGVASPTVARADEARSEDEAKALFEAGRAAYSDARYDEAYDYFERSFRLSGHMELLFNMGLAAAGGRQDDKAISAFERYLEALPNAENREEAERRLRILRERPGSSTEVSTESASNVESSLVADSDPLSDQMVDDAALTEQWWFWTIVGVVVVGAVVGLTVALSGDETAESPIPGDLPAGMTVETLSGAW